MIMKHHQLLWLLLAAASCSFASSLHVVPAVARRDKEDSSSLAGKTGEDIPVNGSAEGSSRKRRMVPTPEPPVLKSRLAKRWAAAQRNSGGFGPAFKPRPPRSATSTTLRTTTKKPTTFETTTYPNTATTLSTPEQDEYFDESLPPSSTPEFYDEETVLTSSNTEDFEYIDQPTTLEEIEYIDLPTTAEITKDSDYYDEISSSTTKEEHHELDSTEGTDKSSATYEYIDFPTTLEDTEDSDYYDEISSSTTEEEYQNIDSTVGTDKSSATYEYIDLPTTTEVTKDSDYDEIPSSTTEEEYHELDSTERTDKSSATESDYYEEETTDAVGVTKGDTDLDYRLEDYDETDATVGEVTTTDMEKPRSLNKRTHETDSSTVASQPVEPPGSSEPELSPGEYREADEEMFPWVVFFQSHETGGRGGHCMGTLVDPSWVVTAAHCFPKDETGENLWIYGGNVDLSRITDPNGDKRKTGLLESSKDVIRTLEEMPRDRKRKELDEKQRDNAQRYQGVGDIIDEEDHDLDDSTPDDDHLITTAVPEASTLVYDQNLLRQERKVAQILIHPNFYKLNFDSNKYPRDHVLYQFDVALLRLEKPFEVSDRSPIKTIELTYHLVEETVACKVLGWGTTDADVPNLAVKDGRKLKYLKIQVKKLSECNTTIETVQNQLLCVEQVRNGRPETCMGDSGSPLICDCARLRKPGEVTEEFIGISLWPGPRLGCRQDTPHFLWVGDLEQWINSHVRPSAPLSRALLRVLPKNNSVQRLANYEMGALLALLSRNVLH